MKQMVGNQLNEVTGAFGGGGDNAGGEKTETGEDPEVINPFCGGAICHTKSVAGCGCAS